MRIASAGPTTVVHTGYELVVLGAERYRLQLREPRLWSPTVGAPLELMWRFQRELLALAPNGQRVAVISEHRGRGPELILVELDTRIARKLTADGIAFVTDASLLSIRGQADGTRGLFAGKPGAPPTALPLPAATTLAWPRSGPSVWQERPADRDAPLSASAFATCTPFGAMVIDAAAGLVVGATRSETPSLVAYRVPTEGEHSEVDIQAYATAAGTLIAHSGGRGGGAINHFAHDGHHLGGLAIRGNASDIAVTDDRAMFLRERADLTGGMELVTATLPALDVLEVCPLEISTYHGYPGLAVADDGTVWAGNGLTLLRRTIEGTIEVVDLAGAPLLTFDDRAWR